MNGIVNGYYRFSVWIMRFALLNLYWLAFTALGLVVLGFMPATTAMFAVVRKWVKGEEDVPILATFWKTFHTEFWKTNGLGLILFLIGYFLVIELNILRAQESIVYLIVSFTVIVTLILYVIVLTFFFPIFVHFRLRIVDYLMWPFIVGVKHPILTVFIFVVIGIAYQITWTSIPALFFFFGGSLTSFFIMWAVSKTFPYYEKQEA
ncbi:YesL family protein [Ornithinibacillus bavariensis]|uniref:DUF624 domain-containing protein n=1 Tax=Ornithinibacillus bavariensis TaxID=545502 RepID=A0A920C6Y4_9BACI|nr:DUF624 domain-containing protein [Ornithinibacillus bavariensis]GIO27088.1 hypothetical protein J43TS3_16990 [Ornithinibacillus bavariensis]HAM80157.1 hypothetical protein [Ornithinibacillus sp.]